MKKVAIITVNYNGKDDTLEFLESLKKMSVNFELLKIVVDNGSDDDCLKQIEKDYPDVLTLQNGENMGFSGGYNRGLRYAHTWGADYSLIINNDSLIKDPQLAEKLIKTAQKDEKIGLVSPKILFAPGFEFYKDRYSKEAQGKVIWYAGGHFDEDNVISSHRGIDEIDGGKYDLEEEIDFVNGGCLLITRNVIEKIGFFDDGFFAYFEDNDYSKRATEAGFKKYYNGTASVYHKVSRTTGLGSTTADYYITRNRLIFGLKYSSFRTNFALWRQALKFFLFGREYQKKAVLDFITKKKGIMDSSRKQDSPPYYPVKLSVITVNYNTPDLIDNLLNSIYHKDSGLKDQISEVIVLDNGSEQSCKEVVKKYPQVIFIQNPQNDGFTGGYNKCFYLSRGEYILMLNSDIESLEKSLKILLDEAENYHAGAVTSGSLFFPDGTLQDSVFYLPSVSGAIKEYFLMQKGSFFMYAPLQSKNTRVEGAAMACFMLPRKIMNKIGFLDERLFTYFEDVDYCRRLKKQNIRVYYTPKAKFLHHHGATGKRLKEGKTYELLQKAAKIYYGKNYYKLLTFTLRVCQKLSWVKTPVAR